MHKKLLLTFLMVLYFCLLVTPQLVHALSVDISQQGRVVIYTGSVLGEETEVQESRNLEEKEAVARKEAAERKEKLAREQRAKEERKVIKTIPENSKEKMRISEEKENIRLRVENGADADDDKTEMRARKVEELEDRRIDANFPAQLKLDKEEKSEIRNKALLERQERKDEQIELKAEKREDGTARFELISRAVKAKSEGAEFLLDPETNKVVVVTPSGNQHMLYHLPDQAIENMRAKGIITEGEVPELELTELSNGEVGYKARITRNKKLFGLFSRKVESDVSMSDQTGAVIEEKTDDSWGNTVLDWLSTE